MHSSGPAPRSRGNIYEPVVEDIRATLKHPPVRRKSVRTRAVIQVTGEGGGGGQIRMNHKIKTLGMGSSGGTIFY